jgi:hypothetical protein
MSIPSTATDPRSGTEIKQLRADVAALKARLAGNTPARFGTIPNAVVYSARSRSRLYQYAAKHEGLFRKDGKSVIVDYDILDRILDALPIAKIK